MAEPSSTRRQFLHGGVAAGALAVAGCIGGTDDEDGYEIWAADQGRDVVHIYEPAGEEAFEETDTIDVAADVGDPDVDNYVPHMLDYSSDYEYAAIACTAGGRVLVYRTEDRELVGDLVTGAGSHFASFNPADDQLTVDVIGENRIAKVEADLEAETFQEVDDISIAEDTPLGGDNDPVCHQFDGNGRSIHTLGPSYLDAGVVVVDHDQFSVTQSFTGDELPANCGTVPHPDEEKFYLTAGLPSDPDGERELADGVGDFYVLDTDGEIEIRRQEGTRGIDAHGFWFPPGQDELWLLNRETNDGVVIDPDTDNVIDEIDAFGPATAADTGDRDAPDIMWSSPDGEFLFVTLRGPNPLSGDPHASTGVNPGFAVFDVEARERIDLIQPAADDPDSDFHGIGVRPLGDLDGSTSPVY